MKLIVLLFCMFSVQILLGQEIAGSQVPSLVVKQSVISNSMNSEMHYYIYFPDAYEKDSTSLFPVIYWLHGTGGWPRGVLGMLAKRFHSAIKGGKIPPTIIIFLDDGRSESMWVDSKDGNITMESVVIREIIPHVDKSFRTINHARGRILEGGSMGGYGTARFGFKYPHLFGAISMINPGPMQEILIPKEAPLAGEARAQQTLDRIYGGDIEYFRRLSPWQIAKNNADEIRGNVDIRMILGGSDPSLSNNKRFSEHLEKLDIKHTVTILEHAGHSPKEMFGALGDEYWEFFRQYLSSAEE